MRGEYRRDRKQVFEAQMERLSERESRSVVSNSLRPHGLQSPWNFPGQNTGMGFLSLLQGILPTQGLPRSPALQADSLPTETPGKPKNIGVGSLSLLLQGIFLTQESNRGLLHCRRTLYPLSYQGSSTLNTFNSVLLPFLTRYN